ncbi:Protein DETOXIFICATION 47, chloroplastic [Halocaridina rubra]|uniref:Protein DETOXIFICATION 47, chloroplastic n=1 Tax=Halocaridina rubra TaxID=373956 RepID=A0AAN8WUY4_HALRR
MSNPHSLDISRRRTFDSSPFRHLGKILSWNGYYSLGNSLVKCFSCQIVVDIHSCDEQITFTDCLEHQHFCQYAKIIRHCINGAKTIKSHVNFYFEKERLGTFLDWPSKVSPGKLAKEGFFYLRVGDSVCCAFCHRTIKGWNVEHNPRFEHQRHCPDCPFVKGKPVGNVPFKHCVVLEKYRIDETTASNPNDENDQEPILGFDEYSGPKHIEYNTLQCRLESFKSFPKHLLQTPEDMAEAGLYFLGLSDIVRCFHCDGGLYNWRMDDIPWEVHARWYPLCPYVKHIKGQQFINEARLQMQHAFQIGKTQLSCMSQDDLESFMHLDIMQCVLQQGFSQNVILMALEQQLKKAHMPFTDLGSAVDAVYSHHSVSDTYSQSADEQQMMQNNSLKAEMLRYLRNPSTVLSDMKCCICKTASSVIIFLPCKHVALCSKCDISPRPCPVCGAPLVFREVVPSVCARPSES